MHRKECRGGGRRGLLPDYNGLTCLLKRAKLPFFSEPTPGKKQFQAAADPDCKRGARRRSSSPLPGAPDPTHWRKRHEPKTGPVAV